MASPVTRLRVLVLLVFVGTITALSLFVWARARKAGYDPPVIYRSEAPLPISESTQTPLPPSATPSGAVATQSPEDMKTPEVLPGDDQSSHGAPASDNFVGIVKLMIPVAGVKPDQLSDTFTDSRSEGRVHDAIDIPAPAGTPVLATTDGEIVKLFQSERGGITIYQLSPDKKLVFYYAHLQRYADGLAVGQVARQGQVIAFVGDTGNAGAGNFHLHFSISTIADPKRYWEGKNINPFPLLRR